MKDSLGMPEKAAGEILKRAGSAKKSSGEFAESILVAKDDALDRYVPQSKSQRAEALLN